MKTLKPEDITILIDSREKTPLLFPNMKVERGGLATGDYSVKGLENIVCVERKSLSDLLMCVGRERERFDAELQRMLAYEARCIVVEASRAEVLAGNGRSKVSPKAVEGSLIGWSGQIHIEFANNPQQAAKFVAWFLYLHARRRFLEAKNFMGELANGKR